MRPGLRLGLGRGFGRGLGRGFGRGRGFWRSRFGGFWGYPLPGFTTPYDPWGAAELTPEQDLNFLKAEAHQLQDEMSAIEQRIQELEREKK